MSTLIFAVGMICQFHVVMDIRMPANIWLPVACITLIFGVLVIYVSDLKIMLPVFNIFF